MVPTAAVTRLWSHLFELSPEQTRARLQSLAARGLLTLERGGYRFHDLQREFLLLHTGDVRLAPAPRGPLAAYRALLPNGATWAQLPERRAACIWDHLIYHFRGAGERHAVIALATDLAYLARRCFRYGTYSAESDLRQTADLYPDEEAVGWLLRLFTEQGNLFADQPVIGDLAATLASRLQEAPPTINRKTLDAVLPPLFLASVGSAPSPKHARARRPQQPGMGAGVLTQWAHARQRGRRDGALGLHQWPTHPNPGGPHPRGVGGGVLA